MMRRGILLQQASGEHETMLAFTAGLHQEYCRKHDLLFWPVHGRVQPRRPPRWDKIVLIRHTLALGFENIVWLDADTMIVRNDENICDALADSACLGMCTHPTPYKEIPFHFQGGVMLIRNTAVSRRFFDEIWCAPETNDEWQDQAVMMDLYPQFAERIQRLDDKWNSTKRVNETASPIIKSWHGRGLGALPKMYEELKSLGRLTPPLAQVAQAFVHEDNVDASTSQVIESLPPYPGTFEGRGIVIVGGGEKFFPCLWVGLRQLRRVGCSLPVELWHLGREEMDDAMKALLAPLEVTCIDACATGEPFRCPAFRGWQLKSHALLYSRFKEVLLLDADNMPIVDPEFLFDTAPFRDTGAIFWPDYWSSPPERPMWRVFGVPYRDEPEFESGEIVIDKERCWRPLSLCRWFNAHSYFFYWHVHGDKDTFRMAWHRLGCRFAMTRFPLQSLERTMCQHDFEGRRIFQHRNTDKWRLDGANKRIPGFLFEDECLADLAALRAAWSGSITPSRLSQ